MCVLKKKNKGGGGAAALDARHLDRKLKIKHLCKAWGMGALSIWRLCLLENETRGGGLGTQPLGCKEEPAWIFQPSL